MSQRSVIAVVVGVLSLLAVTGCPAPRTQGGDAPPAETPLAPPANAKRILKLSARGYQIYTVQLAADGRYEWSPATPDAKLFNDTGELAGTHGKGPSWTLTDGSTIQGQLPPAKKLAVTPDAVPWLELKVKPDSATGVLKQVTIIQRVNTTGGTPPKEGLDAQHAGQEIRVPYTAEYLFYTGG